MTLFGFGKKSDDGAEEENSHHHHVSLFGHSKSHSPAPANPYAQMHSEYGSAEPSVNHGQIPGSPAPSYQTNDPATETAPGSRYGAEENGTGSGYANSADTKRSRYGPTGYGGFEREDSNETTTTNDNRQALFGAAQSRLAQKPAPPPNNGRGEYTSPSGEQSAYGDRQLTAEEEEEEDVNATKQQIRFIKQSSVSSSRNALQVAAAAEESGLATLNRLGTQGERLYNTQKNLDIAMNHNLLAAEKARELKTINSSMLAVHVGNPFASEAKRGVIDAEINENYEKEKEKREATRLARQERLGGGLNDLREENKPSVPLSKSRLAERSLYSFEADDEDEDLENELDGNLDALGKAAARLDLLARAVGEEVESQQPVLNQIDASGNEVGEQIALNRARLNRIH